MQDPTKLLQLNLKVVIVQAPRSTMATTPVVTTRTTRGDEEVSIIKVRVFVRKGNKLPRLSPAIITTQRSLNPSNQIQKTSKGSSQSGGLEDRFGNQLWGRIRRPYQILPPSMEVVNVRSMDPSNCNWVPNRICKSSQSDQGSQTANYQRSFMLYAVKKFK